MALELTVGNTARLLGESTENQSKWAWQLFVRITQGPPDAVAKVVATLHPTFENRHVTLKRTSGSTPSFATRTFRGWGTFTVELDVFLAGQDEPVHLTHMLSFDAAETVSAHLLPGPPAPSPAPAVHVLDQLAPDSPQTGVPTDDALRETIEQRLHATSFLEHDDPWFFHGRGFLGAASAGSAPRVKWKSAARPRDDHDTPGWLTATEFTDQPHVLKQKVEYLAQLLQLSRRTVIYSGAGISVAAQVSMAARGGAGAGGRSTDARPTFTHLAAGVLAEAGLLHGWVQQNHDGLPQKGGFPQECINEIHGSWFDPSNPVVKYSGTLKDDAYPWMRSDADTWC